MVEKLEFKGGRIMPIAAPDTWGLISAEDIRMLGQMIESNSSFELICERSEDGKSVDLIATYRWTFKDNPDG